MGYGVLPFALENDTIIAFSVDPKSDYILVQNLDPKYSNGFFPSNPSTPFTPADQFLKYFWAGYQTVFKLFEKQNQTLSTYRGARILLSGNVPLAAGLSSSASILVACATVALYINGLNKKTDTIALIQQVISQEHSLGINCGGMDQAISTLANRNEALYIQFNPIRPFPVTLPSNIAFVISNSLTVSAKLLGLAKRYNKRVVECRFALRMLAIKLGVPSEMYKEWKQLVEL